MHPRIAWLICLLPLLLPSMAQDADPCADAPAGAAKIMCRQIHKWDDNARAASSKKKIALPPGMVGALGKSVAAEFAPIASSIYQCMDLACMCTYLRGTVGGNGACTLPNGSQLGKAHRKEYRMMTDDERLRFHNALNSLKQSGEYDRIARVHSQASNSGSAHSGPAFLGWHREFMKRVEFAIRQVDPSLFLPYWDSTLDQNLQSPKDSVIFTDEMCGGHDAQGNVVSGPFYPWRTLEGRSNIVRKVGAEAQLFDQKHIDFVMAQTSPEQVMAFTAPKQGCPFRTDFNCLEYTHGNVHIYVGGDMYDTSTSANDPMFFMHHSFVDYIWEQWRLNRQSRADRETAYPPDNQLCSSAQHFAAANLAPFQPMRNIDGLSNKFTDNLYDYVPRPSCSAALPNCGSKFLFCDMSHGNPRCAAKMKSGAACGGYSAGENPCYNGLCQGGRCVPGGPVAPTPAPTPRPVTPPPVIAPQETCFNENQCCATWAAKGECSRNTGYMNAWCKASCGQCKPQYAMIDDCSDRHPNCASWSRQGECTKNPMWMAENCRKSCNKCRNTRAQECGAAGGGVTTTPKPEAVCENSDGCYNENACCSQWAIAGECRSNSTWMACNCRVSCGHCNPNDYNYGECADYHRSCSGWSRLGECEKNPWMSENCRRSCGSCYSQWDLRQMCRGPAGSVTPRGGANRQPQQRPNNQNWGNQGGNPWGGNRWGGGQDYEDNWQGGRGGWGRQGWGGNWNSNNMWGGDGGRWGRSAMPAPLEEDLM